MTVAHVQSTNWYNTKSR